MGAFQDYFLDLIKEENNEIKEFFEEKLKPMNGIMRDIKNGSQRIHVIVKGLRTFSRLDESEFKSVNIVESLKSVLVLVQAILMFLILKVTTLLKKVL